MDQEIRFFSSKWNKPLKSIYFGGGTPSILNKEEFKNLFSSINSHLNSDQIEEVTLECNPEDLNDEKLEFWKQEGVNRLSIGIQSFNDHLLETINRQHRSSDAISGVERARKAGFSNLSMDLIMGLPGSSEEILLNDIEKLLSLDPEHISAYQLSVEEKTALAHQVKIGKLNLLEEDEVNDQFLLLHKILVGKGYRHYEISNYAKPGFEAKHNSSYWSGESYLGIGPGAHSFDGKERRWNISNNRKYAKEVVIHGFCYEGEILSEKDRFNEIIMTSLRHEKGLDLNALKRHYPALFSEEIEELGLLWTSKGWASMSNKVLKLSIEGWLISDSLASELFVL
jgi:oxygen-independent coproporphyrinogen-3 oxidase